jgi:uncharacterized protein YbjT (DUF2867 family)
MTTTTEPRPVVVIGATGKTGRRIVERLNARGVVVRCGSRAATPPFDWNDRTTWEPVLAGARAVYISYFPDLTVPGATADIVELTARAREAGVGRIVLLSGRGEDAARAADEAVRAGGTEWTIVRASWFAQNFTEGYLLDPIVAGELVLPADDVPEPFVDVDDIADVAVAALTEDGHHGQVYDVTGPRALTFAEAAAEIGTALDREVGYVQVSVEEDAAGARAEGVPDDIVELLVYLFGTVLDGRNVHPADGVQRALGRPARDFYDFAWDAARAGAWDRG